MSSLFTSVPTLRGIDRSILTRFLQENRPDLTPPAQDLLDHPSDDFDEFCAAWADQFRQAHNFGPPLRQALSDINTLAASEDEQPFQQALLTLPPEFSISETRNRLHQSLHLWLLAKHVPGVIFPLPATEQTVQLENKHSLNADRASLEPQLKTPDQQQLTAQGLERVSNSPLPQGEGQGEGGHTNANRPQATSHELNAHDLADAVPQSKTPAPLLQEGVVVENLSTFNQELSTPPSGPPHQHSTTPSPGTQKNPSSENTSDFDLRSGAPQQGFGPRPSDFGFNPPLQHSTTPLLPLSDSDKLLAELASLSAPEYDRKRKSSARTLGWRLATLDAEVDRLRERNDETEAAKVFLNIPEPWPDPITAADAAALFDAVHDRFTTYAHLPPGAAVALTLFLGHAHAFPAFHYTPRINITSAKETCGKSTVVKIIASMTPKPFRVQNLRPPVVYRIIDKRQPTVLLDEIETFLPLYRELLGLLNAGNSSDACVPRCEGKGVQIYKAFAPVVLAGIGDLFCTLRSRSILIRMTEAPEGVQLTRFDSENLELEKQLARKLARWAADNLKPIAACDPPLPSTARNRVADNWRPLFQIAQLAGADWPQRALTAFEQLSATELLLDGSANCVTSQDLLTDIRKIFADSGRDRLSSSELIARLCALPDSPWSRAGKNSQPIDSVWLARELRPLGIKSHNIWIGNTCLRGYLARYFTPTDHTDEPAPTFDPGI